MGENPGLFSSVDDEKLSSRELLHRQLRYAREYLDLARRYPPVPGSMGKDGGTFNVVRAHLFKFLYRYLEESFDLRDELADHLNINTIEGGLELVERLAD